MNTNQIILNQSKTNQINSEKTFVINMNLTYCNYITSTAFKRLNTISVWRSAANTFKHNYSLSAKLLS